MLLAILGCVLRTFAELEKVQTGMRLVNLTTSKRWNCSTEIFLKVTFRDTKKQMFRV